MSLVEEAIDCAKTDANIKEIATSPKAAIASKDIPVAMDVDIPEKTDNQNGSKEIEAKLLPQSPKIVSDVVYCNVEAVEETPQAVMDVDIPSNGNNLEEEKNDNETEISEEIKTDQNVENEGKIEKNEKNEVKNKEVPETIEREGQDELEKEEVKTGELKETTENVDRDQIKKENQVINKDLEATVQSEDADEIGNDQMKINVIKETIESESQMENDDQVKNHELKETIENKKANDEAVIREVEKSKDEVINLDQEKVKNQVENRDHENEDQLKSKSLEKMDDQNPSTVEIPNEDLSAPNGKQSKIGEELQNITVLKNESATITDEKNQDQLLDEDNKISRESQNEVHSQNADQLLNEDHDMDNEDKTRDETKLLNEDHEMAEVIQKDDKVKDVLSRDDQEMAEPLYIDESCYFQNEKIIELSRCSWTSTSDKQQYVRGCLWSPDGTCILTAVNMDGMHVINLPTDLYSNETVSPDRPLDILQSVIHVKESGTVYDYCWYPFMNSAMPETCCWISSRQHCPIQLWDGFDGELRASYRGYDIVDEVEAAFSVTFTSDAEKIIGGYKKTLKVFDTKIPGREYTVIPIKQPCSCFAVQATQNDIIATGSWNCSINLYDLRMPKFGSLVTLAEHTGGITFLKFVASGDSLFSGARKDDCLFEWDMRKFSKPIRKLVRNVKTNQRIYFDMSPGEKWLASGDTEGLVHLWNLNEECSTKEYQFALHNDCCNGVGFHPSRSMLATCSGQFHFLDDDDANKDRKIQVYENSLIFWWFGNTAAANVGKDNDDGGADETAAQLAT